MELRDKTICDQPCQHPEVVPAGENSTAVRSELVVNGKEAAEVSVKQCGAHRRILCMYAIKRKEEMAPENETPCIVLFLKTKPQGTEGDQENGTTHHPVEGLPKQNP